MKKEVIIRYEAQDYELLSVNKIAKLPVNPCTNCYDKMACCGCAAQREWAKAWAPYNDANIDDIARKLQHRLKLQNELVRIKDEIESLDYEIPSEFLWD